MHIGAPGRDTGKANGQLGGDVPDDLIEQNGGMGGFSRSIQAADVPDEE